MFTPVVDALAQCRNGSDQREAARLRRRKECMGQPQRISDIRCGRTENNVALPDPECVAGVLRGCGEARVQGVLGRVKMQVLTPRIEHPRTRLERYRQPARRHHRRAGGVHH
jgi:hypothetical protein